MKRMIEWAALSEHIRQRALDAEDVDYSTVLDVLEWIGEAPMEEVGARLLGWEDLYAPDGPIYMEYNPERVRLADVWMFVDYIDDRRDPPVARFYRQHGEMESYNRRGYGVTWRCWDRRPTDEEREAVKWE